MSWLSRARNAFRAGRVESELDEEMRFHLEARAEELMREGREANDAEREARRRMGNLLALREESRDVKLAPWMESLWRDARFGVRMLWKDRVVSLAALVSLALAIGACTAAFLLIDALILRPLPVRQPERLIYLTYEEGGPGPATGFSYPMLQRLQAASREQVELFAASVQGRDSAVFDHGAAEDVHGQFVSGNFFETLGVDAALGRVLSPSDDRAQDAGPVAVLAYSFWMRRFGGSPSVLGRWFQYEGKAFQIAGVARQGFTGVETGTRTDFWVPLTMGRAEAMADWKWQWFRILGRLRPGVPAQQAQQVLQAAFRNARREWAPAAFGANDAPEALRDFLDASLQAQPAAGGPSFLRQAFARPLWILAVVAGLVLLIACSNLANLFTARALARQREMALRISIGAGRGRLVQQLLVEGGLLAAAACALGLAFAGAVAPAIVGMLRSPRDPAYLDLHLGLRTMAFAALAGFAATLLFALLPAVRASAADPHEALKSGGFRSSASHGPLRAMLAAQIGLSFMVLFAGGMFVLSFARLVSRDLGFSRDGVALVKVRVTDRNAQDTRLTMTELLDRVRAIPGVQSAGVSEWGLFSGVGWRDNVLIPGRAPDALESIVLPVSPGFFRTMGMRLLEGRDIARRDLEARSEAVVVNQAFARHFFPGEDPIGKQFFRPESRLPNRDYATSDRTGYPQRIVGLVRDAQYASVRGPVDPTYYIPLNDLAEGSLAVRTAGNPLQVVPQVAASVRAFGHGLEVTEVTLQSRLVGLALLRERLLAVLSGFFGLVAIVLAAVGFYGVLSYSVARRTRELGIRLALGARRRSVVRLVMSEIALVTAAGLAAGFGGGEVLSRFVGKLLYEVKPADVASVGLPLACFLAAAAVAAIRPALRAARVDPAIALREE